LVKSSPAARKARTTPSIGKASTAAPRRRGGPRPGVDSAATRAAIVAAAAEAFSRHGFAGVVVNDIARAAGVNKAMIYYHFADKLALYREIVRDMLRHAGASVAAVAGSSDTPERKIERWIETFVTLGEERPYFPPLMMRELAEGAPHLDHDTFALIRHVIGAFARIVADGQRSGAFRPVNPILAYITLLAPLMFNAARERAAAQPGRGELPMFVEVSHAELTRHMQQVALRMLHKD
jgi:TetR/AcrR family transcriptional regulator